MRMWEVFDPRDGIPVGIRYPFRWMARLVSKVLNLEYALEGDGW